VPHGTGPASPRPQDARKSRGVQSTERFSPSIALSFLITNTWAARLALSVWALPAARKRYVVGPAGYAQQLSRFALQYTGELGDYCTAEEGRVMLSCEV
jgi:hypothetical protein